VGERQGRGGEEGKGREFVLCTMKKKEKSALMEVLRATEDVNNGKVKKVKRTCIAPFVKLQLKALKYGSHRVAPANYTIAAIQPNLVSRMVEGKAYGNHGIFVGFYVIITKRATYRIDPRKLLSDLQYTGDQQRKAKFFGRQQLHHRIATSTGLRLL